MGQFIAISIGVFLSLIILVVIVLLVAKKYLSPSGNVNIEINGDRLRVGEKSSIPKSPTSRARRLRPVGVWVASVR